MTAGGARLLVTGRASLSVVCAGRRVTLGEVVAPALLPASREPMDIRLSPDAETRNFADADLLAPFLATARTLAPAFGRRVEKPRPSCLTRPGLDAILGSGQSLGAGGRHAFVTLADGSTILLIGARVMAGTGPIPFRVVEDGAVGAAALLGALDDLVAAALATADVEATATWRQEIKAHREALHADRQRVATAADDLRRLLSDGHLDDTIAAVTGQGDLWANVLRLVARADNIPPGPLPLTLPDGAFPVQALDLALRPHGLRLRRQRLPEGWWQSADFTPQVGVTAESGRPVALLPGRRGCRIVDGEGRTIADPADAEAAAGLHGHGFAVIPRLAPGRERFRDLLLFAMRRGRREARAALFSTLVVTAAQTLITAATLLITSSLIPDRRMGPVMALAGGIGAFMLCLVFLQVTTGLRQMRFGTVTGLAAEAAVLDRLADRGDTLDVKATGGDLALRLSSTGNLAGAYAGAAMGGGIGLATCLYGVATAAVIAPVAGLAVAALALCWLGAGMIAGLAERRAFTGGGASSVSAFGLAQQIVGHVGTIRAGGASLRALDRWLGAYLPLRAKLIAMRRAGDGFSIAVAGFGLLAGALFYGLVLFGRGEAVSPAAFVALVSAFAFANGGAVALAQAIRQALSNLPMLALVRPLLKSAPPRGREAPPGRITGEIALRHVGVVHPGQGRAALADVSLGIPAGSYIGITGPSGGGKTTLVKAILGLVPLAAGQITMDGRDIARLDMAAVRRRVALVLADAQAIRGTVFDNIRCLHEVDLDGAWRAAERAGLAAEIRAMPMGMFTLVGERGTGLSGGQIQRLLIARALAGNPAILVFDEATSALDAETQAIVLETLRGLSVTRIVVSHRLETLRDAGQILVIADGRLVQQGDFPTLATGPGLFARLAGLQAPTPEAGGEPDNERKADA